eukprot:547810_1
MSLLASGDLSSVNELIHSIQNDRLQEVQDFILYAIKHNNAHTSSAIGRFTGAQYKISMVKLCGKKLKHIISQMERENLIFKTNNKWYLVDENCIINNMKEYMDNEKVTLSEKQRKWRINQIQLAKSTKEYKRLSEQNINTVNLYEPKITAEYGKKRWTGRCKKWRRLIHSLYDKQLKLFADLQFEQWIKDMVGLEEYLDVFKQHKYDNMQKIQFIDQDVIQNQLQIKDICHCQLILKHVTEYKTIMTD